MLKKLLKYDCKYVYKALVIFYVLALFFAMLTRIIGTFDSTSITKIIYAILNGTTISMMFSIVFNLIMRLWARFVTNFYKDEAYLTHTLPICRKNLFNAKVLSSILVLLSSTIIIALTLFICYYSKENIDFLKSTLFMMDNIYQINTVKLIVFIFIIFFLEILLVILSGYMAIILGHRKNDKRMVYSILFGFLIYLFLQIIILISIYILGLFNSGVMSIFTSSNMISYKTIKLILYVCTFMYIVINGLVYFVSVKLFNKGVNIE